jgi:hypothetical protein
VWNLRLCLGQRMQGVQLREIEWASAKESPPFFEAVEDVPQEYGPWQWAAAFGRATGLICAEDARVARRREAALPSRGQPVVERSASRECLYPASRLPGLSDGLSALFFARAVSGIRSQRGSSPSRECGPSSLASTRTGAGFAQAGPARIDPVGGCWVSEAGRALRRRWMTRLSQAIRRDPSACRHAAERFPCSSPTTGCAFASELSLARSARMQCLVGTIAMAHHCRLSFPLFSSPASSRRKRQTKRLNQEWIISL